MSEIGEILKDPKLIVSVINGFLVLGVVSYVVWISLQFIRSILKTSNRITFLDFILLVLIIFAVPDMIYTLITQTIISISTALEDSQPYITKSQEMMNTIIIDTIYPGLQTQPTQPPVEVVPTQTPTLTIIEEPATIVSTSTPFPTPTLKPTIDVYNYNPQNSPPPTPEVISP